MNQTARNSSDPADSESPLERDLFCCRCAYNLRTRRAADACPECGLSVAASIQAEAALPRRLFGRLAFAAKVFALGYFVAACAGLLQMNALVEAKWLGYETFVAMFVGSIVVPKLVLAVAYPQLAALAPGTMKHLLRKLLFWLALVVLVLAVILTAVLFLVLAGYLTGRITQIPSRIPRQGLDFVAIVAELVLLVFAWGALREMTRVPQLTAWRGTVMWVFPASIMGGILVGAISLWQFVVLIYGGARLAWYQSPIDRWALASKGYLTMGLALMLLVFWVLLARAARRIERDQ